MDTSTLDYNANPGYLRVGETNDTYMDRQRRRFKSSRSSLRGSRSTPKESPLVDTGSFNDYRDRSTLSREELNQISGRYRSRLQAEMDLINAKFGGMRTEQTELNRGALARTKVLNANTGLVDSGTGATAQGATEKKGAEALNAIEAERSASLSQAMGQIDELKVNAIREATAEKRQDLESFNTLRTENATKADAALKAYLDGGGDLEKLKTAEPKSYAALSKALGGDSFLKAKAIGYEPKDAFISDKPEIIGNKAIWFKKNGKTGAISRVELDIPADGTKKIKQVLRVPGEGTYVFYEDGTHKVLGSGGTSGNGSSGSDLSEALSTVASQLETRAGEDGRVSPADYKKAQRAWVAAGYKLSEFVSNFKHYINPTHSSDYTGSSSGGA